MFPNSDGTVVKVAKVIEHPKFNGDTFDYDFAILKLEKPLTLSRTVKTIKLPKEGFSVQPGTQCTVSGFGYTEENMVSTYLRSTLVSIIENKKCAAMFNVPEVEFVVTKQMICAGVVNATKAGGNNDACSGDSVSLFSN